MKKRNKNTKTGLLSLFLQILVVLFIGFCICNVWGTVIHCIFNGFDDFLLKIIDLPYLLYLFFFADHIVNSNFRNTPKSKIVQILIFTHLFCVFTYTYAPFGASSQKKSHICLPRQMCDFFN